MEELASYLNSAESWSRNSKPPSCGAIFGPAAEGKASETMKLNRTELTIPNHTATNVEEEFHCTTGLFESEKYFLNVLS